MEKLKHKVRISLMRHKSLLNVLVVINNIFRHWSEREKKCSYGMNNPDKIFYVIKSSGLEEGLLSQYITTCKKIDWAKRHGYIPIVDYLNYKNQYSQEEPVNGTRNAWEYYFEQPSKVLLDEVYKSKNVIVQGWLFRNREYDQFNYEMMQRTPIKEYVFELAREKFNKYSDKEKIGVFIRGTDYTSIKPIGHPVQPSVEEMIEKLNSLFKNKKNYYFYIATEDFKIFKRLKEEYGDNVISLDENFVENYREREYLSKCIKDKNMYEFGLDYLIKMIGLSQCDYLVASRAAGSNFAYCLNNGAYKSSYFFELGTY